MTGAHQFLAYAAVAATLLLLITGLWSIVANRRSTGRSEHRFAVDRAMLMAFALILANGAVGLASAGSGRGPADVLHVVYGPAALVTLLVGVWASRVNRLPATSDRAARDVWLLGAVVVLLAIELRLFMTG